MKTYKLFRIKKGKLFPLYVEANREIPLGKWLNARSGDKADATHVKASGCGGKLSLRPGFHSTYIPCATWIGKRQRDGTLAQRPDTVWCECEVKGKQIECTSRNGFRELQSGWYLFRTNSRQKDPWIISDVIKVNRILNNEEVAEICRGLGVEPQPVC